MEGLSRKQSPVSQYFLRQRGEVRKDKAVYWNDNILRNSRIFSPASLRAARGNGGYTKPGFLWPEQKRLATHQPLIAPDASHGPLMFL